MPSYSKNEVVLLVRYPFSDLSSAKLRPAVVVNSAHASQDVLIVPLTSRTASLLAGEFVLAEWRKAGLNVETAVKRDIFTRHARRRPAAQDMLKRIPLAPKPDEAYDVM